MMEYADIFTPHIDSAIRRIMAPESFDDKARDNVKQCSVIRCSMVAEYSDNNIL